ncbi:uncharacterized protein LOC121050997 [Rosa chinensis]|uniref:uncharacterized protein LOC121050997 n=1 Tax=Rosa chinensis TaxID=74649 RepID=UPI001AD8FB19|nr:uncharacterized protein LOC121050997 [Rosa chinensis]
MSEFSRGFIHHGGYFDKMPDGRKKYKVARFNKDGGRIWLDGLDPDKIAWTEFGNIAWDLGYREKPISYYFKLPRTLCNEGWMSIRNDADALEMVKLIPLKTRQISVFVTGGGRRRKKEAEEDDLRPVDPDWENPLNRMTAAEKAKAEQDANIFESKLNRSSVGGSGSSRVNVVGEGSRPMEGVDGVINLDSNSDVDGRVEEQQASQSTFNGLSDLVPDLFASQGDGSQMGQGQNGNNGKGGGSEGEFGVFSGFYNTFIKSPREKHVVKRPWEGKKLKFSEGPAEETDLAKESSIEAAQASQFEATEVEATEVVQDQGEQRPIEVKTHPIEQAAEAHPIEQAAEARPAVEEPAKVRPEPVEEPAAVRPEPVEEPAEPRPEPVQQATKPRREVGGKQGSKNRRFSEVEKGKKVVEPVASKKKGNKVAEPVASEKKGNKVAEPVAFEKKGKKVAGGSAFKKKGRQTKEARYKTRSKRDEVHEFEEDSDSSSGGSDFYVDSYYDPVDSEDDVQFEENVSNPRVVEEFEEMGFGGECSDDGGGTDELESLNSSGSEEDEEGNPLPFPTWRGIKLKSWNRRVDLKNPKFVVGHVFANFEVLKEAIRECGLVTRRGLWFQKNSKNKIEVKCQLGCPFWLYASNIAELGPGTLVIKTLKPEHKCAHLTESHHLTYHRITKEVQEDLLVDEEWSRKGMQNHIQKKFNLDVSMQKIARGRAKTKRMNDGHYIQQYNMLASYKKELLRSNPGSTVQIKTEMVGEVRRFHRLYICLAACKKGWNEGCRPLIGLDGYHIKGQHPGQLLSAIGVDGNNGMFPIDGH